MNSGASLHPRIGLRPAQRGDAEALVPLVYDAGPAAFDYVLGHGGRAATEFLRHALRDGGGLIGWRNHHVAECDGRPIGCAAFYSGIEVRQLSGETLRQMFRFYRPWHALRAVRRATLLGEMQPVPREHEWYIAHLSVDPRWRRLGVASRLLEHGLELGRQRAKRSCVLDVSVDNPPAQKLYAWHGFERLARRSFAVRGAGIPASQRLHFPL